MARSLDPEEAARECGKERRLSFPVSYALLQASLRGLCDVTVDAALVEDGRLDGDKTSGFHITLADRGDLARRKFTLAHELGHLFQTLYAISASDDEAWCDAFASELLMPRQWILDKFAPANESVDTVVSIAGTCKVAMTDALLRVREVLHWNSGMLSFECKSEDDRCMLIETAGIPDRLRYRIYATPATGKTLFHYGYAATFVALKVGDLEEYVPAQVHRGKTGYFVAFLSGTDVGQLERRHRPPVRKDYIPLCRELSERRFLNDHEVYPFGFGSDSLSREVSDGLSPTPSPDETSSTS